MCVGVREGRRREGWCGRGGIEGGAIFSSRAHTHTHAHTRTHTHTGAPRQHNHKPMCGGRACKGTNAQLSASPRTFYAAARHSYAPSSPALPQPQTRAWTRTGMQGRYLESLQSLRMRRIKRALCAHIRAFTRIYAHVRAYTHMYAHICTYTRRDG